MYDIIVVGGGASGLMASIQASMHGRKVLLLEKMSRCGKKISITGKGRCNVTTCKDRDDIIKAIRTNGRFMYSALHTFDNQDTKAFFEQNGCMLKLERGGRYFPVSDKAQDVVDVLVAKAKQYGVHIKTDYQVKRIEKKEQHFVVYGEDNEGILCRAVIVCTGGKSYPGTGSTGDGYKFAEMMGLNLVKPFPALVPLVTKEQWVLQLQGLSLRNVGVRIQTENQKVIYAEQGEMLFTHFGVSGPVILSASGHCAAFWQKSNESLYLHIDLKPALSFEQLDQRILREIEQTPNKQLISLMKKLLPQKMVACFIEKTALDEALVLHQLSRNERHQIIALLKDFSLSLSATRSIQEAIVTAGGVSVKEINPKSMESKKVEGLFFAGEVLDVDAYTGGFNLQIAFSTGYCAGVAASNYVGEGDQ